MQAELIPTTDPRWSTFLQGGPHDFYHDPAYVALCAGQEGGEPMAFLASEGSAAMLVPMVLRPLPPELEADPHWRDVAAPYGYPCPLIRGDPKEERLGDFLGAFREVGWEAGVVSAFLRMHPLLPLPAEPFRAAGALVDQGETVYLDLSQPEDELDRQTRVNHLADVRKLAREGYRAELDRWEQLDDFIRVYEETMRLHAASPFYFFGRPYYEELRRILGERLHLCVVLSPEGEAAAAGLFTQVEGIVQFHLSGTSDAHRRAGPAKLMLIHMRDWAKARGARFLHLGGGVGCQNDSLAFFKQGFSKLRRRFLTFRMVLAPHAYQSLVQRRGPEVQPFLDDANGFFPAYRRP